MRKPCTAALVLVALVTTTVPVHGQSTPEAQARLVRGQRMRTAGILITLLAVPALIGGAVLMGAGGAGLTDSGGSDATKARALFFSGIGVLSLSALALITGPVLWVQGNREIEASGLRVSLGSAPAGSLGAGLT